MAAARPGDATPPRTKPWWREEGRFFLEILALCGLAIAQPVLDVFGKSPETFAFRGVSGSSIVVFGLVVAFGPPFVVWVAAALTRFAGRTVRRVVQVVILSALVGLIVIQLAKSILSLQGWTVLVVALIGATLFALAYLRVDWARLWTSYLAPAPVIFVGVFLLASPVSSLVQVPGVATVSIGGSNHPKHIVMLVLDELPSSSMMGRDGRIDAKLFPNLAALADHSTWYRNFSTTASSTVFAVPALLTGRDPKAGQIPVAADHPDNLFTLFGGRYEMKVDESFTRLCPDSLCTINQTASGGLRGIGDDAVAVWKDQVSLRTERRQVASRFTEAETATPQARSAQSLKLLQQDFGTAITNAPVRFNRLLDDIKADEPPTLHYLHLLKPHQPWETYPSGMQYRLPAGGDPGRTGTFLDVWGPSEATARLGRQRHLLQVQATDALVGRLVARLRAQGIYDDTLLVVVADHGVSFEPNTALRAEPGDEFPATTWSDIIWPPLLIKAPGQQKGSSNDWNVQGIDVLPTIADLANVKVPWRLDGASAAKGPPRPGQNRPFYKVDTPASGTPVLGSRYEVDGDEGLRRVIARGVDAFRAPGDPKWAFYRVGPDGDQVGRRVSTLTKGDASLLTARVVRRSAFDTVEPGSGSIPGLVTGRIAGAPANATPELAIAVNGTLAAVTETFAGTADPHEFAAILPDFLFRTGRNVLAVYEVEHVSGSIVFHPASTD